MNREEPIILLVEDSEDDVFFMRRALTKAKISFPVHVARNGQEALDYLAGEAQFSDRSRYPVPTVIFLDLKLPYVSGFEVLEWIRRHPALNALPVIILTSSAEERDRQKAVQLGVKCYLVKPPTPEMISESLRDFLAPPVPAEPQLAAPATPVETPLTRTPAGECSPAEDLKHPG